MAGQPDYQHTLWDQAGKPYWANSDGGKTYISPASAMSMFDDPKALAWAKQQGYEIKGGLQGVQDASKGTVGADGTTTYGESPVKMANQGGGLWHTTGVWNGQTGQFEHDFDYGNLFTMLVAAGMTVGVASAVAGGAVAGDAASSAAASQALGTSTAAAAGGAAGTTGAAAGGGLGAVAGGGAATTAATVPASLAAVGGTAGATAGGAGLTGTIANALISKGIPALATTLGGAAKSAQTQNNIQDQTALSQGNLALNRDKFALDAPNTRLSTAIKASLASNYTPQHTQWAGPGSGLKGQIPVITGGISGGMAHLDPRVKDLSNQIMMDELTGQKNGGVTGGGQDRAVPQVNQSSVGDKILGGGALATSILGALSPALKNMGGGGGASTPGGSGFRAAGAPGGGDYQFVGPPDPGPQVGGLTEDEIYQMMQGGE